MQTRPRAHSEGSIAPGLSRLPGLLAVSASSAWLPLSRPPSSRGRLPSVPVLLLEGHQSSWTRAHPDGLIGIALHLQRPYS